jgi:hypothetical protein
MNSHSNNTTDPEAIATAPSEVDEDDELKVGVDEVRCPAILAEPRTVWVDFMRSFRVYLTLTFLGPPLSPEQMLEDFGQLDIVGDGPDDDDAAHEAHEEEVIPQGAVLVTQLAPEFSAL